MASLQYFGDICRFFQFGTSSEYYYVQKKLVKSFKWAV